MRLKSVKTQHYRQERLLQVQKLYKCFCSLQCELLLVAGFLCFVASAVTASPPAFLEYKPVTQKLYERVRKACNSDFESLPTDQAIEFSNLLIYRQPTECRTAGERAFCKTLIVHESESLSCISVEYSIEAIWPQSEATALVGMPHLEVLPNAQIFLFLMTVDGGLLIQSNHQTFSTSLDPWIKPLEFDTSGTSKK